MITTCDKSMLDDQVVFIGGTNDKPYIDRIVDIVNVLDEEVEYYTKEVIIYDGQVGDLEYLEYIAGERIYREHTQGDYPSYRELKEKRQKHNAASAKDSQQDYGRTGSNQTNTGTVKNQTRDADYLSAVERGDMKTAQRMVDEAAKAAGYTIKAYHGTSEQFTEFDITKSRSCEGKPDYDLPGFYFTSDKQQASDYGDAKEY